MGEKEKRINMNQETNYTIQPTYKDAALYKRCKNCGWGLYSLGSLGAIMSSIPVVWLHGMVAQGQ